MNTFNINSQKFYNQFRNGLGFTENLTDFSSDIIGNEGEIQKTVINLSVSTEIIASDFGSINYDSSGSQGNFVFSGNWFTEGVSTGVTIEVSWNGGANTAEETVIVTAANAGTSLKTTKVNLGGLTDGDHTDLIIRVKSAPNFLYYKYSLNSLTATSNDYTSPFDSNEQAYWAYLSGVTTLNTLGQFKSWSLGSVTVEHIGTTVISDNYVHEFEINHIFKVPYFIDGELGNIDTLTPPSNLVGSNTLKYGYGVFFGANNPDVNQTFEDVGNSGSVGYFNENFNGFTNNYEVLNVAYNYGYALEGTQVNTVTFQIKNNNIDFVTGDTIILTHSKLPTQGEYTNKTDLYGTVWLFENIEIEIDAVATSGTIFSSAIAELNVDPTLIDVTIDVEYTSGQQTLIEEDKNYLIYATVGNPLQGVSIQDRVNLIISQREWTYDNDVYGLVQNNEMYFNLSNFEVGDNVLTTDFKGWDTDFVGCRYSFETKADEGALISGAVFRLMMYNGIDWVEFNNIVLDVPNYIFHTPSGNLVPYQICNTDVQNGYNITANESFNRIFLNSEVPLTSGTWQEWQGGLAFKVNWRDWIANSNIPNSFYDNSIINNNKNNKVSNYSNVDSYEIYAVLDLEVSIGFFTSNLSGTRLNLEGVRPNPTIYRLKSEASHILDFDVDGGTGVTGLVKYYDENDNLTDNIFVNENVRIEIEFDFGVPISVGKSTGEIIIEQENTTQQEWRLSTSKDWTNNASPIQPSNGTQFVDISASGNIITLKCQTNRDNLQLDTNYNIYGRLQ